MTIENQRMKLSLTPGKIWKIWQISGIHFAILCGICWLAAACSTPSHVAFENVVFGQKKADVLELLGSPQRTQRARGQDLWTYHVYKDKNELIRQITFKDGQVVNIETIAPESSLEKELQETTSIQEYEERIRASRIKNGSQDSPIEELIPLPSTPTSGSEPASEP